MRVNKIYYNVKDLSEITGMSESYCYKVIRKLRKELINQGYICPTGKIPVTLVEKRLYISNEELES